MKKVQIPLRVAKILDYTFWTIGMTFAFLADWRVGVAFLAFDIMRAFEDLGRKTSRLQIGNIVVRVDVVEVLPEKQEEKPEVMPL